MDRRYQVFVSSTYQDLKEERKQVMQALLELDCIPSGMELFPASDETQWSLIKKVIDDCDYYILIVGGRYGSIDEAGLSYTEREYDYAVSKLIPILAFLHAEPESIPVGKSELNADARLRLQTFKEKVQKKHCKYWQSAEELGGVVSRGLIQSIKLTPGEGWVRGKYASAPEMINQLRQENEDLKKQLNDSRTNPPAEANGLAKGSDTFILKYRDTIGGSLHSLKLSWDDIFSCLGPLMIDEASESELETSMNQYIKTHNRAGDDYPDVDAEDFKTVVIQLMALGLIQKSIKKRAIRDTSTYWSLTAYGEHYIVLLKAIPTEQ